MRYVRERDRIVVEESEPEGVVAAALLVLTAWRMGDRSSLKEAMKRLERAIERTEPDGEEERR